MRSFSAVKSIMLSVVGAYTPGFVASSSSALPVHASMVHCLHRVEIMLCAGGRVFFPMILKQKLRSPSLSKISELEGMVTRG